MNDKLIGFREKFKIEELTIYESEYWIWSLRPHQPTIGAGILSLKRPCERFSSLKAEEYCDLNNIVKVIEGSLKHMFNFNIMNYLMLMMIDKQVHYHVIPRYKKEVEVFDTIWSDKAWPGVPDLAGENLDMNKLVNITSYIKSNLKC